MKHSKQHNLKIQTRSFFLKISFFSLTSDRLERKEKEKIIRTAPIKKNHLQNKLENCIVYLSVVTIPLSLYHPVVARCNFIQASTHSRHSICPRSMNPVCRPRKSSQPWTCHETIPLSHPIFFPVFTKHRLPPPLLRSKQFDTLPRYVTLPLYRPQNPKKGKENLSNLSLSLSLSLCSFPLSLSLPLSPSRSRYVGRQCTNNRGEKPAQRKPSSASDSSNFDETSRLVSRSRPKFRIQGSFSLDRPRYRRTINEKTLSHWRTRFAMASECLSNVTYKSV